MTITTANPAPWMEPGYLVVRDIRREQMRRWYDDSVSRGFINPNGDFASEFQDFWRDCYPVQKEFNNICEWLCAEARARGFKLSNGSGYADCPLVDHYTGEYLGLHDDPLPDGYLHIDRATDPVLDIQEALDSGQDLLHLSSLTTGG